MNYFYILLKNRLKTSFALMAGLLMSISIQGQLTPYTPEEVVFKIEGDEYFIEYILLDEGTTASSRFFVMNRNHFNRNRAFSASTNSQKFDPAAPDNIGYFLNSEEFRTVGNGPQPTGKLAFSKIVTPYIDFDHVWHIEAGHPMGQATEYDVSCGIAFLSKTEWLQYSNIIGYQDNMENFGWYLRSPDPNNAPDGNFQVLAVNVEDGSIQGRSRGGLSYYLRPAYYLNENFFKEVRLNLATVGESVKAAIRRNYTVSELSGIYAASELALLGYKAEDLPDFAQINYRAKDGENVMKAAESGVDITLSNLNGDNAKTYDITCTVSEFLTWPEAGKTTLYKPGDTYTRTVTVAAKQSVPVSIDFNPHKGYVKVEVTVKNGDEIIEHGIRELCLIDYYQRQFLDEYSTFGFNAKPVGEELDYLKRIGILNRRAEYSWSGVEQQKGVFSFTRSDAEVESVKNNGINTLLLLDYSNELWIPTPNSPNIASNRKSGFMGAYNKEGVDAFARYAKEMAAHYPHIKRFEIYNEPAFSYWQPANDYKALDYSALAKATAIEIRSVSPDVEIVGGSFAFGGSPTAYRFMDDFFNDGALKYLDGVAYHPYYGNDPYITVDAGDVTSIVNPSYSSWLGGLNFIGGKVDKLVNDNGGFKEVYNTEVGYPTVPNEAVPLSEIMHAQAKSTVKQFIYELANGRKLTTIYCFRNPGTDPAYSEDQFGIITVDYQGKPAYAAVSQLTNVLNGCAFQGKVDLGDPKIIAYLFAKNGEPVIVAWTMQDYTTDPEYFVNLNLPNRRTEDMYGNLLPSNNTISLDNIPKYIYGVSNDFYANSVSCNAPAHYEKLLQKITDANIVSAVTGLSNAAKALTALSGSAAALTQLNANYQAGADIVNLWKNGSLTVSDETFMNMLFEVHCAGKNWASLYAAAVQNEGGSVAFDKTKVNAAVSKIQGKLNPAYYTTMTISEELLRQAKQHSAKAEFVSAPGYYPGNPGKTAVVAYEQILSEKLAEWTSLVADFETVNDFAAVLMYVNFDGRPAENKMDIAPGGEKPATVQIDNTRRTSAISNVTVVVLNDNGAEISESAAFSVPAGATADVSVAVKVPLTLTGGKHVYKLVLKQNGHIISSRGLGVNVSGTVIIDPGGQLVENTPPANTFKIVGDSDYIEYILLNDNGTAPSKFFILNKNHFQRNRPFGSTQRFTTADGIGLFLNSEEFWTEGNGASAKRIFSPIVTPYIDKNHVWSTEAGYAGSVPTAYNTTCGITFLSQTEWQEYSNRIGYKDDMADNGWYLRSPYTSSPGQILTVLVANGTIDPRTTGGQSYYLRPAFYLNDNFFKEVKLDIASAGSNVRAAIRKNYPLSEIRGGIYSDEELTQLGYDLTGLDKMATQPDIGIYPNPVSANNAISLDMNKYPDVSLIEVYDVPGVLIQRTPVTGSAITLNAPATPGIYLYLFHTKDKSIKIQRVIVK
ncbi:hypothetical protein AGMMS50239_09560 [Bacteroidia bacterium]|nr:hypothetical protein AGMMS50239_09560 [Bacteroidia bacterium]